MQHPRAEPASPQPVEERRRPGWSEFRHSYPGLLAALSIALLVIIAADIWLVLKWRRYRDETDRLWSGMSSVERQKTQMALASDESRLRIMLELIRRQARVDKALHLSVSVDSGVMRFEQEGALLRETHVEVGPEKTVGQAPDTIKMVTPRGARTVERILGPKDAWEVPRWVYSDRGIPVPSERTLQGALGPVAVVVTGGTVIYSMPSVGPLNDSAYVLPGGVRARAADLRAVVPNLKPGVRVYFY
jgi:hypothetical protein